MSRHRNDILSDLRLANFHREPLKYRLALLLKLTENQSDIDDLAKSDIADHVRERLVEMDDEIRKIKNDFSEANAEDHAAAIETLVEEYRMCDKHPVIKNLRKEYRERWKIAYDALQPLWTIVQAKKEDDILQTLWLRFEQVPDVDWTGDWLIQTNRAFDAYKKIRRECDERTWIVRREQAEELKREIDNKTNRLRTEINKRT